MERLPEMKQVFSSADRALAQRIESGHAFSGVASAQAAQAQNPDFTDAVEPMAGGWAVFQGVDLPFTQALGIGMAGPVTAEELDRLEAFFHSRNSPAIIDLCTLADPGLLIMIQQRGYVVRELSNVLVRRLDPAEEFPQPPPGIEVRPVGASETRSWARIIAQGFFESEDVPEEQIDRMSAMPSEFHAYFGLQDGMPASGSAMGVRDGLATLFGDATLVPGRGRGLQLASIHRRLQRAAQLGCDLASASVWPGTISHRNYERAGFQLVYLRIMLSVCVTRT